MLRSTRSIFRADVDGKSPIPHDDSSMRRIWLTVLLAFSLAITGAANAWAAQACPYKAMPAMHDCCPDEGQAKQPPVDHGSKKAPDCHVGQVCRASVAVAPSLPSVKVAAVQPVSRALELADAGEQPSPMFAFWRPPRTV